MFPVVFHPVAPPKSISLDSGKRNLLVILDLFSPESSNLAIYFLHILRLFFFSLEPKPFIDISVITRFNEYSKVLQFK